MTLGGLWSAVIGQAEAEDTDQTERALALVETLLDRYGVIAQPVIDKEISRVATQRCIRY